MAYRSVEPKIWQDVKFHKLNKDCKLLFLYLITNPHSHYSGIYHLPLEYIEYETGISTKEIVSAIANLSVFPIVKYDTDNSIVWVVKMAKYQCKSNNGKAISETLITGLRHHIENIESSLVDEFCDFYSYLLE